MAALSTVLTGRGNGSLCGRGGGVEAWGGGGVVEECEVGVGRLIM